jgi:hypothetical protein
MGSMGGLRRGAAQLNKGGGGGARRVSYYARFKPPQANKDILAYLTPDETRGIQLAEPVVFLAGEYEDIYQRTDENGQPLPGPVFSEALRVRMHTFPVGGQSRSGQKYNRFIDITCSAGPESHAPQPCLGCHSVDKGESVGAKDQWIFNIAHLAWYHEMPLMKEGQIAMRKDGKGPVMIKNECQSYKMLNIAFQRMDQQKRGQSQARPCEGCAQNAKFIWGEHRLIQVGKNQLNNILDMDSELAKSCMNCGTGVITVGYDCEKCSTEMLDVAKSGWTNAQIKQFSETVYQCQKCGHSGRPMPAYECGYDLRTMQKIPGGCPDNVEPRPLGIFDVVMWIQREGDSTQTEMVVKQWTPISRFTLPDGRLSGTEDNKPLGEALQTIVPTLFDLKKMYAPQSLDDQAKAVKRPNPYAQQQQQYQAYGQPQQNYGPGAPPPQAYGPVGQPQGYAPQQPQQPQQWGPPPQQQQPQQPQPQQPPQQLGPSYGPPGTRPNYR